VTRFSREIIDFLVAKDVKAIVVACNTASALALPELEGTLPVPVVGVIEAGASAAAQRSRSGKVGVIATASTDGKTGVEMEALAGVSIAALTIYDMCKAIDKAMVISDIRLESKTGGRSGDYKRTDR